MKVSLSGEPNESEQIEVSKAAEGSEYVFTITKAPISPIDFKHIIAIDKSGNQLLDQQLVHYSVVKNMENSSLVYKCNLLLPEQPQDAYVFTCPSISEQFTYKDYVELRNKDNNMIYEYRTYQLNSNITVSIHFKQLENGLNNIKFGFSKVLSPIRHIYAIRLSTLKETKEYHFIESKLSDKNEYKIPNIIFDKFTQITWAVFDILYEIPSTEETYILPNGAKIIQKKDLNDNQNFLTFELEQETSNFDYLTVLIESDTDSIVKSNFGLKNNINIAFSKNEIDQKIGELSKIMISTDHNESNEHKHIPLWYSKYGEFWIVDLLNCIFPLFEKGWFTEDFGNIINLLLNNPSKVTTLDFIALFQSAGISLLSPPNYSKEFLGNILSIMLNYETFETHSSTIDDTDQIKAIFDDKEKLIFDSNKRILLLGSDGLFFSNKSILETISFASSQNSYSLLFAVITKEKSGKSFVLPSYVLNEEVECNVQLMVYCLKG